MDKEKAVLIVDKIIEDISDRSGLQNIWEGIDEKIRAEIRQTWINIVLGRS